MKRVRDVVGAAGHVIVAATMASACAASSPAPPTTTQETSSTSRAVESPQISASTTASDSDGQNEFAARLWTVRQRAGKHFAGGEWLGSRRAVVYFTRDAPTTLVTESASLMKGLDVRFERTAPIGADAMDAVQQDILRALAPSVPRDGYFEMRVVDHFSEIEILASGDLSGEVAKLKTPVTVTFTRVTEGTARPATGPETP